jgi:hypothetical protein
MPAQEVIGHPTADAVELDALADDGAARQRLVPVQRQHLRRQHLQLQRHQQTVLGPAGAEAEEHLAGDEHFARGTALQAVEVGEAVGIGLVRPVEPELLHLDLERGIGDQRRRLDAGADDVAGPALDGIRRIAVVADQPAGARGDVGAGRRDQRVEVSTARLEALQPAIGKPGLEAADEGTDPPAPPGQHSRHLSFDSPE